MTLNYTDCNIQPHAIKSKTKLVLRMLAHGTVRNGRKNGISIQSEVFGIQLELEMKISLQMDYIGTMNGSH